MVNSIPSFSPQHLENWEESTLDAVSLTAMVDAEVLNCGHSYSASTVGILLVSKEPRCPECREIIVTHVPNYSLRKAQEGGAGVVALVAQHIPLPILPFPGKAAQFKCVYQWKPFEDLKNPLVVRRMDLFTTNFESFIMAVSIYGNSDDSVSAFIQFSACNPQVFRSYFAQIGLPNVDYAKFNCSVSQSRELDWVLSFLMKNNTFTPACNVQMITRLFQEKKWRDVELQLKKRTGTAVSTATALAKELEALQVSPTAGFDEKAFPSAERKTLKPSSPEQKKPIVPPRPHSDHKQVVYG